VEGLSSPDEMKRGEAATATTVLAPPFLQDVLIEMTKSKYAYAAIVSLREADTPKTRQALASIASGSDDSALRIEAISNLGRTGDVTYLSTLTQLMASDDQAIQNAAAVAAGVLGVPQLLRRLLP
jgi:HEAT repeat protein